jgi:hypothetical protein
MLDVLQVFASPAFGDITRKAQAGLGEKLLLEGVLTAHP